MPMDPLRQEILPIYVASSVVFLATPFVACFCLAHTLPTNHLITISGLVGNGLPALWFTASGSATFTSYRFALVRYETKFKSEYFEAVNRLLWLSSQLFFIAPIAPNPFQRVTKILHFVFLAIMMTTLLQSQFYIAGRNHPMLYPVIGFEVLVGILILCNLYVFFLRDALSNGYRYLFFFLESIGMIVPLGVGKYLITKQL